MVAMAPGWAKQDNTPMSRITFDPHITGGQACIRGMRLPVATIVRCVASGMSTAEILDVFRS